MGAYDGRVPPAPSVPARPLTRRLRGSLRAVLHPTAHSMRALALASVVVNVAIVVSGGAVRVTESGLGCPTWPRCTGDSLVPVQAPGTHAVHMAIEFGNRLISFLVFAVAVLCVVAAYRLAPRRRDLTRLALVQLFAIPAQAVLGGVTVLTDLSPASVAVHFLFSMVIVAATVSLYERASEGDAPPHPTVRQEIRLLGKVLTAVVAVLLVLGTIVTGTGPLAGDARSPRFDLSIEHVAQLHADAVWATVGLTFALLLAARLTNAPAAVTGRAAQLLALELAQGAIGYAQYFLGVPPLLVGLHVLGATLVWVAAWRVLFALRDRGPVPRSPAAPTPRSLALSG